MNENELIEKIARKIYRIDEDLITLEDAIQDMEKDGMIDAIKESFKAGQESMAIKNMDKDMNEKENLIIKAVANERERILKIIDEMDFYDKVANAWKGVILDELKSKVKSDYVKTESIDKDGRRSSRIVWGDLK